MHVLVSSRHMEVSPPLKAFAEERGNKLLKFYDRIQEIEVIIDHGKDDSAAVEMIVNAEHHQTFIAKNSVAVDAYAAIDECYGKLERQLTDYKEKHRNRKHPV